MLGSLTSTGHGELCDLDRSPGDGTCAPRVHASFHIQVLLILQRARDVWLRPTAAEVRIHTLISFPDAI
jgi:hypothetical protein